MKKLLLLLLLTISIFGNTGKVLNGGKFYEMRDSTFILWTSRNHSDSTLDTLALINKDGIWIPYGEFSDSLWALIIRGAFADLDSAYIDSIFGHLKGEADSSRIADTAYRAINADSSDLLDGYNEDYFLDTNTTRIDTATYADNLNDSTILVDTIGSHTNGHTTFIDDVVFDSTVTFNISYRSETRCDTFPGIYLVTNLAINAGLAIGGTATWSSSYARAYINFNSGTDFALVLLDLMADSVYIDSVTTIWGWQNTPPDADTFVYVFADSVYYPAGAYCTVGWTKADTLVAGSITKDTYGQRGTFAIGKGYKTGNPYSNSRNIRIGGYYLADGGAGNMYWTDVILYYKSFMRR